MISVGDALKILDQIPIWKQIRELPRRVTELENRLAQLEGKPKPPTGKECALCGAEMKVLAERPHIHFGDTGIMTHSMECVCGHTTSRMFIPGKGYQ